MNQPEKKRIPRVMDLRGTYKGGGGPDKTVLNSAAQHDPERVYVLVTYLRQPWDHEFQIPEMARRLGINYVDVFDGKGIDWKCLFQLKRLLKEHRLGIVHAHDDKTLLYGWLLSLMVPALRIMYTCHSHAVHSREDLASPSEYLRYRLRQKIQIFLMRRYGAPIITISSDTRRRLLRNGLPEGAVQVLHNGIDLDAWRRQDARQVLKRELGLAREDLLVGTVARITPEKDIATFFDVAERVTAEMPAVKFVVVGDGYGDELARARSQAAGRGLERKVVFTGHRNDLVDVYSSLDLFLMTSVTEGMPNTLLEAMALGVPAVATNVGGIPEVLVDGDGGYLAPAGDSASLSALALKLLRDPALRQTFGVLCRQRIEKHFSFTRRVRSMESYYDFFAGITPAPSGAGHE